MTVETQLLTESAVAAKLAVSKSLIRKWRRIGFGPNWLKLGKSVRYSVEDVAAFLQGRKGA